MENLYEPLRTTFHYEDGTLYQQIADPDSHLVNIARVEAASDAERQAAYDMMSRHVFDHEVGPLMQAWHLKSPDCKDRLVMAFDHSIADGWSRNLVAQDIAHAYTALADGEDPHMGDVALQYADFALEDLDRWREPTGRDRERLDQWVNKLGSLDNASTLAEKPSRRPQLQADTVELVLTDKLAPLYDLARQRRCTLFAILSAATGRALGAATGADTCLVSAITANRHSTAARRVVGSFFNTVPLPLLGDDSVSWDDAIAHAKDRVADVVTHQDIPFEVLSSKILDSQGGLSGPRIPILFQLRNVPKFMPVARPDMTITMRQVPSCGSPAELAIEFEVMDDQLHLLGIYQTHQLDAEIVRNLLESIDRNLQDMLVKLGAAAS